MKLTDFDMMKFESIIKSLDGDNKFMKESTELMEQPSYFVESTDEEKDYCIPFAFSSVEGLYQLFDRYISKDLCSEKRRDELIRCCIAACFKYAHTDFISSKEVAVSEFVYEF